MAQKKSKKLKELNYKDIYQRVLVGLEDNKKFIDKYKHNKNYLKGLQLLEEKKEHQTVVEYVLPIIYTHLPNILPASFDLDVQYSIDTEQNAAYYSKMLLKDLYQKRNYYYQFALALLDVLSSGLGWTHQTYRTLYTPEGKTWTKLPIVERVSPVDMIWDRTGYHFEFGVSGCINWVARRIRRPTMEIQADERYDKTYTAELKGQSIISDTEQKDKDLTIMEIWWVNAIRII